MRILQNITDTGIKVNRNGKTYIFGTPARDKEGRPVPFDSADVAVPAMPWKQIQRPLKKKVLKEFPEKQPDGSYSMVLREIEVQTSIKEKLLVAAYRTKDGDPDYAAVDKMGLKDDPSMLRFHDDIAPSITRAGDTSGKIVDIGDVSAAMESRLEQARQKQAEIDAQIMEKRKLLAELEEMERAALSKAKPGGPKK